MIFVAASTCSAQKSNWYLFQPNNQGINGKFNFESNDGNDVHLDISYLCSGFYFIIVESDSLNYTGKIIITRNK
jgi:hypothetical protein